MRPFLEVQALCVTSKALSTCQFLYLAPRTLLSTGPPGGQIRYLPDWPSPGGGARVGTRLDSSQVPERSAASRED